MKDAPRIYESAPYIKGQLEPVAVGVFGFAFHILVLPESSIRRQQRHEVIPKEWCNQ
jgi:hypothetical protein